jgi:hypothetical protein
MGSNREAQREALRVLRAQADEAVRRARDARIAAEAEVAARRAAEKAAKDAANQ